MSQPFSFGNVTAMSHIDTPICQYLVCFYQKTKRSCQTQIYDKIYFFRSKVNVIQWSWVYATHCTIVVHLPAKESMITLKDIKAETQTQSNVINAINLTLRSKVNILSGSWIYTIHLIMVIHLCAIYGMPVSKQTKGRNRTQRFNLQV